MRMSVMKKISILLIGIVLITIAFYQYNKKEGLAKNDKVFVEDFKGKNDSNKIQSAINKAESSKIKTVLLDEVFERKDLSTLNEIANTISEDLVLLFNGNDKPLKEYFASSRYSKEITYEEFFIWWYHFFYTKVTEELIKQGVIITSAQKNQTYIIH